MSRRVSSALALATAPRRAAERHPDVPIYLARPLDLFPQAGDRLTYQSLADLVDQTAAMLLGAGLAAGGRVLIVKEANFDIPLLALGCARARLVPVLVHSAVGADDLAVLVERCKPVALVTDARTETGGLLDAVPADVPRRLYVGAAGRFGAALTADDSVGLPTDRPADADPQLVTHSSGTTGVPKLVLHSVRSFAGHARPQVTIGRVLRVHDPYLMCLSPVHARTMSGLLALLALGLPMGFLTDPGLQDAATMLERLRPGVVETVPNDYIRWEQLIEERPELLSQIRLYVSSFDAAHPRTVQALLAAARPGARYMQAYGQTETGPVTIKSHRLNRGCQDGRCVGRGLPGQTKIKVADPSGTEVLPRGVPGAVFARSSGITPSYLGSPDQRVEGWWSMGDYGVRSKRGCLHLYDRLVDRATGVDSLLATEDTILERMPQLTEAVLISVGDGTPPVPLVCTRGDAPLDLAAWSRAVVGLPELAAPHLCRWEDIPHTATWKVKRPEAGRRLLAGELVAPSGQPGGG